MNWNSAPSIRVKNVSGSEIPARSFVKLNGNSGGTHFEHYVEVDQPDGTEGDYYLVTGPHAIADNKIGKAFFPFAPVKVKHSSVPSYVEEVGPASGSWELSPSGSGFVALKQHGDYSFVVSLGSGSSGGTTTATPCGCDFVSAGSVDCLGTGDSANVYVVDDLGPLGTNVELTFDASCEWISPDIDYDCSGS